VEDAFGGQADFAQLHKIYRASGDPDTRYSPAKCIGCEMKEVSGRPDPKHVSTSFVERQNWTTRGTMRRYTRLSNGFSRKLENHAAATALNYFSYNFIKIHRTLRTSPAMAAGVTDRLWSVENLVALWEYYEQRRGGKSSMTERRRGFYMIGSWVIAILLGVLADACHQHWLIWPILLAWAICFGILYVRGCRGFSK
jgi:hypothetical protein